MFLLNSRLGLFSAASSEAPLLPKLRGQLAEFLNNLSPVGLRIFFLSTCVGLRYGLHSLSTQLFSPSSKSASRSFAVPYDRGNHRPAIRFKSVLVLKYFGGYGISTVCASATRFRLTLAPGLLGADEPSS